MPESYVIVPADSTGKQLRTWTGSVNVNAAGVHSEAVVLTLADAANSFVSGTTPLPTNISGSTILSAQLQITGSTIPLSVQISGSSMHATLTAGSGSTAAANGLDVNVIAGKNYKSAAIALLNAAANSMSSVVAAVAQRHLKVYSVLYNVFTGAIAPTWEAWYSSGAGLAYSQLVGPMVFNVDEGYAISVPPPAFLFRTNITGSALYLSSSQVATHGGVVSYWDDDLS